MQDFARNLADELVDTVWKTFPFRSGNRVWLFVIAKGYCLVLVSGVLLSCVLNSVEGKRWLNSDVRGNHLHAYGDTALDECAWFVLTTIHGIAFGEFQPRTGVGRFIAMVSMSAGYWFPMFLISIVLLSQLAGEKTPTLGSVLCRMVSACWPSYAVFLTIVLALGSQAGPYVSSDHGFADQSYDTGCYWFWQVCHRMPFGDLYPNTPFGRQLAVVGGMLGNLYMPYALVCIAVRRYTLEQHRELLENLRKNPEDALGRGYIAPPELKEVEMPQI